MKIYRFLHDGAPTLGVAKDGHLTVYSGNSATALGEATGQSLALSDTQLLAPVDPRKIVAVGRNYAEKYRNVPEIQVLEE